MQIPIEQLAAFADGPFTGNPAAVCVLEHWLPDALLQAIAAENNLSETAFVLGAQGHHQLRWFTPSCEGLQSSNGKGSKGLERLSSNAIQTGRP